MTSPRYAVYFAPSQEDPLARFGAAILGYDAETGWDMAQPELADVDPADWRQWTDEPRRYGFHATLKAPFRFQPERTEAELFAALEAFALRRSAFGFALRLARISGFVALVPAEPSEALVRLEREIVEEFDVFRAPLTDKDIARRLALPLTGRQRGSLDRFGYPYVFEDFRFHMTLSGRLNDEKAARVVPALQAQLDRMAPRPRADLRSLAIFRQDQPDGRFRIVFRAPLV